MMSGWSSGAGQPPAPAQEFRVRAPVATFLRTHLLWLPQLVVLFLITTVLGSVLFGGRSLPGDRDRVRGNSRPRIRDARPEGAPRDSQHCGADVAMGGSSSGTVLAPMRACGGRTSPASTPSPPDRMRQPPCPLAGRRGALG